MRKLLNLITFGLVSEKPKQQSGNPAITADELLNMAEKDNPKEIIQEIKKATEQNPFTVTKYNGEYYVLLGKYQLEKPVATKAEALKLCEDTSWVRLMQVMRAVAEDIYNERKLNETITRQSNGKTKETGRAEGKPLKN